DDINSFTILSLSQGALTERRYDFSPYQCNISFGYSSKFFNTDNNVFVGHTDTKLYYSSRVTNDSIIYKTIDFSLTNVQETTSKIRAYELFHNYPNPFNPTTKIEFQIEDLGFVDLKVYDVLGNEVATLVNEEKSAGIYEVEFNGSELTSGIYFYQLKAGNFVETKKMIVLK
ncbi:MAG: T9SS type A sorting domain-containing protein, partial [Ignavibacteria bacterium]|nr:T9SS type A sorting domain-containing protein [Ignavibacteria bacterium]